MGTSEITRADSNPIFKISVVAVAFGLALLAIPSRTQAQVSIFGGYSYLRASVPVGSAGAGPAIISQSADLASGWEAAAQVKVLPMLGGVADFSGNQGTLDGAAVHVQTYLFGPQLSLPGRFSLFIHALFGVAHEQQDAFAGAAPYSLGPDTSFATALGGGIDVKAAPFVALRLIQIDYLRTKWHGITQNQPRISAGIVLHF